MKKIFGIFVCILLILCFTSTAVQVQKPEIGKSDERPFHISTLGITCPMGGIPGTGWICSFRMLQPWPDGMYFSLFAFINYENGTTTIINNDTGETIQKEGAHKVLFYKFYGPVSSFGRYNVSVEGNAAFAMVIGG
ncbi:MAG: hypothetical protein U9R21_08875 [Candidatus Thermoplasmatota archaeon]|nr:hypothetical protein [Candidatus Thermoplasmatota archaeon]